MMTQTFADHHQMLTGLFDVQLCVAFEFLSWIATSVQS